MVALVPERKQTKQKEESPDRNRRIDRLVGAVGDHRNGILDHTRGDLSIFPRPILRSFHYRVSTMTVGSSATPEGDSRSITS